MNKIGVIYRKDIHSYFTTITGYVFMAAILLVGGIYVFMNNIYYGYASFGESINYVSFFFVFLIPVLSAGVFTDEKRQKTDQLLYTLPLKSTHIVLGKYFALVTVLAVPMIVLGIYPLVLSRFGSMNLTQAYTNLLAVFLLGMTLISICMFISSLMESIVVSAIICFAVMFLLYQMNGFADAFSTSANRSYIGFIVLIILFAVFIWYMTKNIFVAVIPSAVCFMVLMLIKRLSQYALSGKINLVMSKIALFKPLENFKAGILDVYAIIYYVSIIVLFVLFTVYTFERKRWH